ncbi:hypothetical protein KJ616_02220 [Patescibacteria group bacterium]|nr:hypothetical protein [Patescibacteria group bacterium]
MGRTREAMGRGVLHAQGDALGAGDQCLGRVTIADGADEAYRIQLSAIHPVAFLPLYWGGNQFRTASNPARLFLLTITK